MLHPGPRTLPRSRSGVHAIAALALLGSLAAPSSASARELLIASPRADLVEEVTALLAEHEVKRAVDVHSSQGARLAAKLLQAEAQAQLAHQAYQAGEVAKANLEAQAALAAFEEVLPVVRDFAPIVRLHLLRADLASAKEDTATAEDNFMSAARFGGELELDPATASPIVIEGFKAAHELLTNSPPGGVNITSTPADAEVFVDGESKGTTPLTLDLPAGPHLFQVAMDGHDAWAQVVPIDPSGANLVEVSLVPQRPLDRALSTLSPAAISALRGVDADRDWLVVLPAEGKVRYALLLEEREDIYGGPVAMEGLEESLKAKGWNPGGIDLELIGMIAAGAGGGVGLVSLIGALSLDSVLLFSDLGSGEDRDTMQLTERILLGVSAVGMVVGAAGGGLLLYLMRPWEGLEEADARDEPDTTAEKDAEVDAEAASQPEGEAGEAEVEDAEEEDEAASAEDALKALEAAGSGDASSDEEGK